jgi:hypothetical protein
MSNINTQFDSLKSYIKEENSKTSSLSGLVKLDYKEYDDSFKDFFDNITLNSVNYKIFIYIYYLLKNQYQLLAYEHNKEDFKETNSFSFNNKNLDIVNKEVLSELNNSSAQSSDPTKFKIGERVKFNFNNSKKGIDELIELINNMTNNAYDYTEKENQKEFMYYHLLNIVKIVLNDLLTQEKIIDLFKTNNNYTDVNKIIINNIFNDSESQYSFTTNTINEYEYYTTQFLDKSQIGFMTNFIYDLNIVKNYYQKTKESLLECLNKLKTIQTNNKITLDDFLKNIIDLNLNYLVLGSFAIDKSRNQDYYKLLLTYYFYNIIIPILSEGNNLKKLQDIRSINDMLNKIPDGESKNNLNKFIEDISQQKIYNEINNIFMSKIKELLKQQEQQQSKELFNELPGNPNNKTGQTGGSLFFNIKDNESINKVFIQSLLKVLNNDIENNAQITDEKYQIYQNLYNFIKNHYKNEEKKSYFFLVRNFYKTYVSGNIYNNIMIFKNNLYILDDYYKYVDSQSNLKIVIQLSNISNIDFNYGKILSLDNKELSLKHFILNYYGTQKNKSYNFINLNSILDLFKKVDNKVENEESTNQLNQKIIYRFGSFVFESNSNGNEIDPEENNLSSSIQNSSSKNNINDLIQNFESILNLIKSQIIVNDLSINLNFYNYNQLVNDHLIQLLESENSNLFEFGFMIENNTQCDNITNILNNLYDNIIILKDLLDNLINIQTLKELILTIIKIFTYYIKIEIYLFYSYLYWNKDIDLCKKIMDNHEKS